MTDAAFAVLKRLRGRPYATASTTELCTDQRKVTKEAVTAALEELARDGYVVKGRKDWQLTGKGRRYGYETHPMAE